VVVLLSHFLVNHFLFFNALNTAGYYHRDSFNLNTPMSRSFGL
jgi:hypothetical protein